MKFYPLRRFFSATTCCKHSGVVGCVAGSLCHSFVVSGGSEGECGFSNPVRRTFHGKIVSSVPSVWKYGGECGRGADKRVGEQKNYQQTWFQLEYAKKSNMFRMSEGFKLEEFETKSEKMKRRQTNTALVHSTVCCSPALVWGSVVADEE